MSAGDLYLTVYVAAGPASEPEQRAGEFADALEDLRAHLPSWWATDDESSEIHRILQAIGVQIDRLSDFFDSVYADQSIATATTTGLYRNYAFAYGVQQEQLPPTSDALRAYIQARAAEDGSALSLVATLMALLATPANIQPGTPLTFPAAGGGLTFPPSGGLTLWQYDAQHLPPAGLTFPADGSGLRFPNNPQTMPGEATIVADGTTPLGSGAGLTFAVNGFLSVIQDSANYRFTIQVKSYLAFDRQAFARAVDRFRLAHLLPATIVEVNS